ncbi:MAG: hypothetical protein ACHQNE_07235 [Candidatus Kapaibacterium sp.]
MIRKLRRVTGHSRMPSIIEPGPGALAERLAGTVNHIYSLFLIFEV